MPMQTSDTLLMDAQEFLIWSRRWHRQRMLEHANQASDGWHMLELTSQSNCWQISIAAVFWPSSRRLFMLFAK